tara:strand:- start:4021 stop:4134 length:114 start_codon:yes stop_codon:yes gene_type:complete
VKKAINGRTREKIAIFLKKKISIEYPTKRKNIKIKKN